MIPAHETRFVLLKPGDVLLIGNAPSFGPEDLETLTRSAAFRQSMHQRLRTLAEEGTHR